MMGKIKTVFPGEKDLFREEFNYVVLIIMDFVYFIFFYYF